ncbi:ATP-binding protein [Lentimicrobium sp.]|jgi:two-component system phosphate regulon sensor histidine kinase PhoR|uniref:sensor histidine kinase n=1 Tax=Lentimicrobium sp. TaxID=2034841 RepID=UPI0025F0A18E|nr:ATP-binding protein [Lentimicrobium sp.]MCO5257239.1 ATP-binding protein [Lentimicrobium sp.]MCO5262056.1 ATP-binding protein [Lentimicrobium sp.]HOP12631.1 ATP-binding protein [Lentimicrobium sp.]HPF63659.1 ATP-binding protein [Lentimicrobium sp.]HPJ61621.1 ATP-binding protein [Lentimicrobium sp.]
MNIDFSNPRKLALNNALLITALFLVLGMLFTFLFPAASGWWLIAGGGLVLFVFTNFLFRYTLEKFIYEKIRLIYKTIRNRKISKDNDKTSSFKGKTIETVYQEVAEWGETKSKEVEELKRMANYRREFLGNVSHELKTPIFNIQGYVLTLLDGGLEDPSINKEYLLRTEKSINRMIAIVEDLETISQLESSELQLNLKKTDILALTREVMEFLEIKARKRNNTVYFGGNYEKPVYILADKERLRQVLINLIDNSIKYGNQEDGSTKISFFDMDENILVEVTDNGNGINEADLPRIFERFYRTDKGRSREQGGSGLGLAIVKHIIEAHDQTIHVRSTQGVGTTFAFTMKKA